VTVAELAKASHSTIAFTGKIMQRLVAARLGASSPQVAAATNAIMGLEDEWEEVGNDGDFGYRYAVRCADICSIAQEAEAGTEFKLLRRRAG
jgi:hypothetical protein